MARASEKDVAARAARAAGCRCSGVCLGSQLLAEAAGASARRASAPEIGWHDVDVTAEGARDPVLGPLAPRFRRSSGTATSSHCRPAPPLSRAATSACRPSALDNAMGIQFHAEVSAADAEAWIDDYRSDEDAVRIGVDPDALRRRTRESIGAWNDVGRALCERFLDAAATRA